MIYIDSSSLLKLLWNEPESFAVIDAVAAEDNVLVSVLTELEVLVQLKAAFLGGDYKLPRLRQLETRFAAFRNQPQMIGGVVTSGILELLIYPVIYVLWRKRHLGTAVLPGGSSALAAPGSPVEFSQPGISASPIAPTGPGPAQPSRRRPRWLIVAALLQYTCPMHPDVVQNSPGKCPKCGMDLVEKH